ncbi:tRNA wybutosine-synthesizing protein 2/3/4 isoform X2 [Panicum miliaceum]|uniref:tRNA wybutosine-synthesizing protein 2/3/4 n=1 Tax=Panicum miliaceum TaxID=4540 RepID=A0A3L6QNN4_PANMI|nr:tRNA wybutosine-synthesizing protein 2/3/4 isoform X2 [Panicum miliaceum]
MDFARRKAAALAALSSPAPDKSPKGGVDAPIAPLLEVLNSHPDLFTTSSCSGRVSVLAQPQEGQGQGAAKPKKKARGGGWVYVSHDPADPDAVVEQLFGRSGSGAAGDELVFRFEPMIVAVECSDAAAAAALVAAAISAGFRESGITSLQKRAMVAIRCSIRMEVPLGQSGELVVSPEYVRYLVRIANSKMEANKKRMDGFLDLLQTKGLSGSSAGSNNCNGSQPVDHSASFGCEVKMPLGKGAKNNDEYLVPKRRNGGNNCDSDDRGDGEIGKGSLEAQYFENQNSSWSKGVEHGFEMIFKESPSPRMGHTVTSVGNSTYVIGGRGGPSEILDDVWVLQSAENTWLRLECSGNIFRPRHRHAAAAVASKIYVFGGLSDEGIYSCMNVFDTKSKQWSMLPAAGEWPCARHSHSLVSYGSKLFMFGGHDGQQALNDFYSFDTTTLRWNKESTNGGTPSPRFSHCMFIYKNYLGILGGCPITGNNQEVTLLNLKHGVWFSVSIPMLSQCLCVRSSSVLIEDDLVIVGGGASCYAFGTRFNQPIIVDLHSVDSMFKLDNKDGTLTQSCVATSTVDLSRDESIIGHDMKSQNDARSGGFTDSGPLILQLEKKYAKLAKDILKKFGWLDLARKVRVSHDNSHVLFPVNEAFHVLNTDKHSKMEHDSCTLGEPLTFTENKLAGDNLSLQNALKILSSCNGSFLKDELAISRKPSKSPQTIMKELVSPLLGTKGMSSQLLEQLPARWETLGDIIILPKTCFKDPLWESVSEELWPLIAKSLGAQRLARQGKIMPNGTRDSTLELLLGDNGWVTHHENGIRYSLDATKCMFSSGNRSEKLRMGQLNCRDEVVVDLFAGIGYFVLPFLVKANAKFVYACEWNPHALEALRRNVRDNHVEDRCIILEGDNRATAPKVVWHTENACIMVLSVCQALNKQNWVEGGILHIHGNVNDSDETRWLDSVVESISDIAKAHGLPWNISLDHVERVKWYGPHIRHLVVDVRCQQI